MKAIQRKQQRQRNQQAAAWLKLSNNRCNRRSSATKMAGQHMA